MNKEKLEVEADGLMFDILYIKLLKKEKQEKIDRLINVLEELKI